MIVVFSWKLKLIISVIIFKLLVTAHITVFAYSTNFFVCFGVIFHVSKTYPPPSFPVSNFQWTHGHMFLCPLLSQERYFWISKPSWRRCTRSTARTTTMPSLCWRATRKTNTSSAMFWSVWRNWGESPKGGKTVWKQISASACLTLKKRCTSVTRNVHVRV